MINGYRLVFFFYDIYDFCLDMFQVVLGLWSYVGVFRFSEGFQVR